MNRPFLLFAVCLCVLFSFASVRAQEEPLSLDKAETIVDVRAWIRQEERKHDLRVLDSETATTIRGDINKRAGNRMLELTTGRDRWEGYNRKIWGLHYQMIAGVEGAEQEMELFLEHLAQNGEAEVGKTANDAFLRDGRFFLFRNRVMNMEVSPENFEKIKAEIKSQIDRLGVSRQIDPLVFTIYDIVELGFQVAEKHGVSAEQLAKEMAAHIRSPECPLPEASKTNVIAAWERKLRLTLGVDPKLFGKTIDNEDFDWESLRGKHVLIKFTATWCVPCKAEFPGMLEAYEKYHGKGLEIISVYILERGSEDEQIALVKTEVEREGLPWIILSEAQTTRAGQPLLRDYYFYSRYRVPTMVLVDNEGIIILTRARGNRLQTKLAEIFE